NFVEAIQKRQGFYIACLEEIAYNNGWIGQENVIKLAKTLEKTEYSQYLIDLINNDEFIETFKL
ncbi:MAG: hypothetical protein ACXVHY_09910, partial [Methanobacterium sp.]